MRTRTVVVVVIVAGGILLGLSLPAGSAQPSGSLAGSLEGVRRETLRALAHRLDEGSQGMLEGTLDEVQRGATSDARFLASIRAFAVAAGDFRRLLDPEPPPAGVLSTRIGALRAQAQLVNGRIRSRRALATTYDDWTAILVVLDRMDLLLGGQDVDVPPAHVVPALSGVRLQEFRQLAEDVENAATRAHQAARRGLGDYPQRGAQFLGELNYLVAQSRVFHQRADAGEVQPQQIGRAVDLLLEEARQADRALRDAEVFASARDDLGRTITLLERMAGLVRSGEPVAP